MNSFVGGAVIVSNLILEMEMVQIRQVVAAESQVWVDALMFRELAASGDLAAGVVVAALTEVVVGGRWEEGE